MVNPPIGLVLCVAFVAHTSVVVGCVRRGRQWVTLEEQRSHGINPLSGHRIVQELPAGKSPGEGLGGGGIVDFEFPLADLLREDSLALQQRRHRRNPYPADCLPRALVVRKEESPIPGERPAEDTPELIAPEPRIRSIRWRKEIARVQGLVAQKLECGAVELNRPGSGGKVHHPPVEAPELSGGTVGLNLEFLNPVDDRKERHRSGLRLQH